MSKKVMQYNDQLNFFINTRKNLIFNKKENAKILDNFSPNHNGKVKFDEK